MGACSSSAALEQPKRHAGDSPDFEAALKEMVSQSKVFTTVVLYARGELDLHFAPCCDCKGLPTRLDSVPEAGIIFKGSNSNHLLEMTDDAGLVYQRIDTYRFSVPRFRAVCTLKGRIEPSDVLQYLSGNLKMKVFTPDGSLRYHDFAVSFFDQLRLHSDPNVTRLVVHANEKKPSNDRPMKIPPSPLCIVSVLEFSRRTGDIADCDSQWVVLRTVGRHGERARVCMIDCSLRRFSEDGYWQLLLSPKYVISPELDRSDTDTRLIFDEYSRNKYY